MILVQLIAPALAVVIGFILNRKLGQIHVLVNSRMDEMVELLRKARVENVQLKDSAGVPVSTAERELSEVPPKLS